MNAGHIDTKSSSIIKNSNTANDLADQFVPRHLLRATPVKLLAEIDSLAQEKYIEINYICGDVVDIRPEDKTVRHSSIITVDKIGSSGQKTGEVFECISQITVIAFGSPKKELPDEISLKDGGIFCRNPYHPASDHILHPKADLTQFSDDYILGVGGTKLSAVDIAVILHERGYYEKPNRKTIFFSPSGEFPLPHERVNSNSDKSYKTHSLINDVEVSDNLRHPKTAQDLTDSLILSIAYAAGLVYKNGILLDNDFKISKAHLKYAISALQRAGKYIQEKFTQENRRIYGVQIPIIEDYHAMMSHIWSELSAQDKIDFVHYGQNIYDTYRHCVPANILDIILKYIQTGQIIVKKTSITSLKINNNKTYIDIQDGHSIKVDAFAKAMGWERRTPISLMPVLEKSYENGVLCPDKETGMGVVVSKNSEHNILIVGQLNWIKYFEIQGLQRLLADGRDNAKKLLKMVENYNETSSEILCYN